MIPGLFWNEFGMFLEIFQADSGTISELPPPLQKQYARPIQFLEQTLPEKAVSRPRALSKDISEDKRAQRIGGEGSARPF